VRSKIIDQRVINGELPIGKELDQDGPQQGVVRRLKHSRRNDAQP
jgi:hypothetical protein